MNEQADTSEIMRAIRGIKGVSYSDYQNYPTIIEEEKHSETEMHVYK